MHEERPEYQFHGLTSSQYHDCIKAGRSPKTGRLYRTSAPSALEIKCRKINWAKCQLRGSVIGIKQAMRETIMPAHLRAHMELVLDSMEKNIAQQLTDAYEDFKLKEKSK